MANKKHIPVLILILFLNIVLISVNAQETNRNVEVDADHPGPEFIIHWRYNDFSDNARADTVVSLIEDSIKEAWQII